MARILVIDDDDLLREVLVKTLEVAGHTVAHASNGHDGLKAFRANPADLVLTDLLMPVQEGIETIMQLRRQNRSLPIIAMSGGVANSKLYLSLAGGVGAHRLLAKPFTPQQLIEVVNELLPPTAPAAG